MLTPLVPAPKLATALGVTAPLFVKREDLHPLGSHKGRSLPIMIDKLAAGGAKNFVISSSGNAGLAALLYIQEHNQKSKAPFTLQILVGKHIDASKLAHLKTVTTDSNIKIFQTGNPKQAAFTAEKSGTALLRQSTSEIALEGYANLAAELLKETPNLAAVFVPTSSGTTAEGLHRGFKTLGHKPEIHIVQTSAVHPFIETPHSTLAPEPSLANAIVDRVGHRKPAIEKALKNSHGAGWVATNTDIENALKLANQTLDFKISPNSALALVGLQKAILAGHTWAGAIILLVTGA